MQGGIIIIITAEGQRSFLWVWQDEGGVQCPSLFNNMGM